MFFAAVKAQETVIDMKDHSQDRKAPLDDEFVKHRKA
jgi:hypothetical protein